MSDARIREGHASIQSGDLIGAKLVEGIAAAGPDLIFKSCANCNGMDATASPPFCTKRNGVPPANIIVVGCPQHEDVMEIPF